MTWRWYAALLLATALQGAEVSAARFSENPLITVLSSPSVGDNVNGPSIIRVPEASPLLDRDGDAGRGVDGRNLQGDRDSRAGLDR